MEAEHLTGWLDRITFSDLGTDEVTARLIDETVAWGEARGWRVYRRAPSVLTLPPPLERQHSVIDVACARIDGPPIVVEVDHTDRRRTVDKLLAEAQAGRIGIWLRWGPGEFRPPPMPVQMATFEVTRRSGRRFARTPALAPPMHGTGIDTGDQTAIEFGEAP